MNKATSLSLIAAAVALAAPGGASASTLAPDQGFFADDFTDNGACSLREVVEIANDDTLTGNEGDCADNVTGTLGDDTILLEAGGPYVLSIPPDASPNDNQDGDLDVNDATAPDDLTISGAGAGVTTIQSTVNDRVLHIAPASTGSLTVTDAKITGGNAVDGGGGGGVFTAGNATGSLTLERVRVTGNGVTTGNGGGINHVATGAVTVRDSTIDTNTVTNTVLGGNGGGAVLVGSTNLVEGSVIAGNTVTTTAAGATPQGGGLRLGAQSSGSATLLDSVIRDNDLVDASAAGNAIPGGAGVDLALDGVEKATTSGTTISANEARTDDNVLHGFAGGIRADIASTATADVTNSTLSGNRAEFAGGIGLVGDGTLNVVLSTFGSNEGGLASAVEQTGSGAVTLEGVALDAFASVPACFDVGGGNDIVSLNDNVTDAPAPSGCNLTETRDAEGATLMLGALQDNGGPDAGAPGLLEPVPTHAPVLGSPLVDRGPALGCQSPPEDEDQRGFARPADGDGDGLLECDTGSVELQPAQPVTPPAPSTAPAPIAGENPECDELRHKLKKAKRNGLRKKVRKLRRKLRELDC